MSEALLGRPLTAKERNDIEAAFRRSVGRLSPSQLAAFKRADEANATAGHALGFGVRALLKAGLSRAEVQRAVDALTELDYE